jgi:hypothetical protein
LANIRDAPFLRLDNRVLGELMLEISYESQEILISQTEVWQDERGVLMLLDKSQMLPEIHLFFRMLPGQIQH